MKILYIIIGDLGRSESGSGLRPNCMYHAFLERGHEVYVLSGYQGRKEGKLRDAEVKKAIEWAEENNPDLCYIESSTYPMIHSCDYKMIWYLAKKGIPTSYFYRDFYRRFKDLFPRRKGFINTIKEYYLDFMQWRTDRILRKLSLIYFPSKECFQYFNYKNMKALPPAGSVDFLPEHINRKICIYVGGISDFYGFPLLIDTFTILNKGEEEYKLILVCREAEFKKRGLTNIPSWLSIYHVSGKSLEPLYEQSDLGLLTLTENAYSNLAIGTKLFQYLSYGLPVLSTDVEAMSSIITENNFGEVAEYDAELFAKAIREILSDDNKLNDYRQAIKEKITNNHLWVHRVDQIIDDLIK